MNDPQDRHASDTSFRQRDWPVALTLALAILIVVVAFVWLFLQIDPFLSDFVSVRNDSPTVVASPVTP
jgi:hypothetical protein